MTRASARGLLAAITVATASDIPALAEAWFLMLDAEFVAMMREDLQKAGLDKLGSKWS